MFKRIDHVELIPSNIENTIKFYTDILGFKIKERIPIDTPPLREVVYLTLGDIMVEFINVENPAPKGENPWVVNYVGLALEVDDMDETTAYLKGKGVKITWGPVDLGDSSRAEIKDPDGLTIELRQWF